MTDKWTDSDSLTACWKRIYKLRPTSDTNRIQYTDRNSVSSMIKASNALLRSGFFFLSCAALPILTLQLFWKWITSSVFNKNSGELFYGQHHISQTAMCRFFNRTIHKYMDITITSRNASGTTFLSGNLLSPPQRAPLWLDWFTEFSEQNFLL